MDENQIGKYLKYAIGEIFLVVLGILIALQINNWNEARKRKTYEIAILNDIKSDIDANISNIETGNEYLKIAILKSSTVLEYVEQQVPEDQIDITVFDGFFTNWDPDFTYASFENLKREGVNLIADKPLRQSIVKHFEVDMMVLDEAERGRVNSQYDHMIIPMRRKYFYKKKVSSAEYAKNQLPVFSFPHEINEIRVLPSDYNSMIRDQEFYNITTDVNYRQQRMMIRNGVFLTNAREVSEKIGAYIKENDD